MSNAIAIGVPIRQLRPTQMTVGLREVALKREAWRNADADGRAALLRRHVLPAVIGPKKHPYIVDHHHFARALLEEDVGVVAVYVLANLSHLPKGEFWTFLDNSAWCHAYDGNGTRCALREIPKRLDDLADDPFRSIAGELIRVGACAKSSRPFAEFLWADFLRHRIDADLADSAYQAAVKKAVAIARRKEARALPGWCGGDDNGL